MIIAVCDDNTKELDELIQIITKITSDKSINAEIKRFNSSKKYLEEIEAGIIPDISFLDIIMDGFTGVELAKKLMEKTPQSVVIFVTHSTDYMADGFEVGAVHYLVKPFSAEDVGCALQRAIKITGIPEKYITLSVKHLKVKIALSEILYIESKDKYCYVYTSDGTEYVSRIKLSDISNQLNDIRFLWCHRSFVVNMDFINKVEKNDFVLKNGQLVPIRSRPRAETITEYENYRFRRIWKHYE